MYVCVCVWDLCMPELNYGCLSICVSVFSMTPLPGGPWNQRHFAPTLVALWVSSHPVLCHWTGSNLVGSTCVRATTMEGMGNIEGAKGIKIKKKYRTHPFDLSRLCAKAGMQVGWKLPHDATSNPFAIESIASLTFPRNPKAHAMQLGWPEFVLATSMPHRHIEPRNTLKFRKQLENKLVHKVGPHLGHIPGRCWTAMNAPRHLTAKHLVRVRGRQVANALDDVSLFGAQDLHCLGDELISLANHSVSVWEKYTGTKTEAYFAFFWLPPGPQKKMLKTSLENNGTKIGAYFAFFWLAPGPKQRFSKLVWDTWTICDQIYSHMLLTVSP